MQSIQEKPAKPPDAEASRGWHEDTERLPLKLTFDELVLIFKALQAVKTLDGLPRQDELLDDTIDLVDRALSAAVRD